MANKKISFTLPDNIIKILNKKIKTGEKSEFVSNAIRSYVNTKETQFPKVTKLEAELIVGYISSRKEDLKLVKESEGTLLDGLDDTDDF